MNPSSQHHPAAGSPVVPLRIGSLCTGYGGLDLAVMAAVDAVLVWCADNDRHASTVLAARFPQVANLGDLTRVDWAAVPKVDLVTAGFPCQDISFAGRGAGIEKGTRSGLWADITRALRLLRPGYVFVENVAALRSRGLGRVLADLAALGYDTQWACLRAADAGAPHHRRRLFILGHQPHALGRLLAAADPGRRRLQRRRAADLLASPARPAEQNRPRAQRDAAGDRDTADSGPSGIRPTPRPAAIPPAIRTGPPRCRLRAADCPAAHSGGAAPAGPGGRPYGAGQRGQPGGPVPSGR